MQSDDLKRACILIVDDEPVNVRLLERILQQAGYTNLVRSLDPTMVAALYAEHQPDLILLDLHMPRMDGFAVMEHLAPRIPEGTYLPILVLTADVTQQAKERALAGGAKDFLTKPFDATEVVLRIENLLETRRLHLRLKEHNLTLEEKVRDRTQELVATKLRNPRAPGTGGGVSRRRDGAPYAEGRRGGRRSGDSRRSGCDPGRADPTRRATARCGEDRHPRRHSAQTGWPHS